MFHRQHDLYIAADQMAQWCHRAQMEGEDIPAKVSHALANLDDQIDAYERRTFTTRLDFVTLQDSHIGRTVFYWTHYGRHYWQTGNRQPGKLLQWDDTHAWVKFSGKDDDGNPISVDTRFERSDLHLTFPGDRVERPSELT